MLVRYEKIDRQQGALRGVGYDHLIPNMREWINCFIKTPTKYTKLKWNKNYHICRAWHNASCPMVKPMKSLELHLMIQFLIMYIIIINSHVDENRPQLDDPKITATEIIDKINEGLYSLHCWLNTGPHTLKHRVRIGIIIPAIWKASYTIHPLKGSRRFLKLVWSLSLRQNTVLIRIWYLIILLYSCGYRA